MPAILDRHGQPYRLQQARERIAGLRSRAIRARYDAVQTNDENVRHWSMADSLSADAANSSAVRQKFRDRSRYEYLNNAYYRGMVETLAADVIGTGPRLQVLTGKGAAAKRRDTLIEARFRQWARAVRLGPKLRAMRRAKCVDGETVGLLTNKPRAETPVWLNLRPRSAERLAAPWEGLEDDQGTDGVRYDTEGDPVEYHILRDHPGGTTFGISNEGDWIPATEVVHLFREDRPEQHRGVPEVGPALPLFAVLRRYTQAELLNCEVNAEITAVLETEHPELARFEHEATGTTTSAPSSYSAFDVFDLERNAVLTMPGGTRLNQLEARRSSTTYAEFKREVLAEAFAALVMPYNVGAHDSSEFNYASGKLDRLTYGRIIRVEQSQWDIDCLFRVFLSWWLEARLVWSEWFQIRPLAPLDWSITWHWDGIDDIDPAKAATARKTDLDSGSSTLPLIYGEHGLDWRDEFTKAAEVYGLTLEEYQEALRKKHLGGGENAQQGTATEEPAQAPGGSEEPEGVGA